MFPPAGRHCMTSTCSFQEVGWQAIVLFMILYEHFLCPIPRHCVKLTRLWTYSFQSTVQQTLVSSVSRMPMAHTYFIQNIVTWLVSPKILSDRDVLCLQVFRVWWSMTRSWSLGEQTTRWWRPKPQRWPRKLWQPWGALAPCACRPRPASPHGQGIMGALPPSRSHCVFRPLFHVFCPDSFSSACMPTLLCLHAYFTLPAPPPHIHMPPPYPVWSFRHLCAVFV